MYPGDRHQNRIGGDNTTRSIGVPSTTDIHHRSRDYDSSAATFSVCVDMLSSTAGSRIPSHLQRFSSSCRYLGLPGLLRSTAVKGARTVVIIRPGIQKPRALRVYLYQPKSTQLREMISRISGRNGEMTTLVLPGVVDRVYPRVDARDRFGENGRQHCRQRSERFAATHPKCIDVKSGRHFEFVSGRTPRVLKSSPSTLHLAATSIFLFNRVP